MKKFISVSVLRDSRLGDCTNKGLSSKTDLLYIEHPRGWIKEENAPEALRVDLIKREIFGSTCLSLKPSDSKRHCMAGGNFAWSCDSRFREAVSGQPVSIHDRIED
jgi:hypothetical protein